MVNVSKLKKIMKERNITEQMLSVKLNVKTAILAKKLDDGEDSFTIGEADEIVRLLKLDAETATEIFFANM